jgi:hypothetical protein
VVSILGKGGKWRYVLISQGTADELLSLKGDAADAAAVFTTSEGRMTTRTAARIVNQAAEHAKIKKAVSPHWLRHCCASHSLDRRAPIHIVQASLGHSSVTTTGRTYTLGLVTAPPAAWPSERPSHKESLKLKSHCALDVDPLLGSKRGVRVIFRLPQILRPKRLTLQQGEDPFCGWGTFVYKR